MACAAASISGVIPAANKAAIMVSWFILTELQPTVGSKRWVGVSKQDCNVDWAQTYKGEWQRQAIPPQLRLYLAI